MGQAEIIIDMVQCQLLAYAVLTFAEGDDASPHSGDMLADAQVDALDEGGVDLPAAGRQHLLDRLKRAEHDAVAYADQTPPAHGLDDPRIKQTRQGHPAGLGRWPLCSLARRVHPLSIMCQQRGRVRLE